MKARLLTLGLCVCLALSLCGCTPVKTDDVSSTEAASLAPSDQPTESAALETSDTPEASSLPADETATPSASPETDPSTPSAQPDAELTAADVYAMWLTTSSQFPAPAAAFVDMSDYVSAYYTPFSASDVESFVFYQPDMSATPQDVFIAKAKPGKVEAVKAACQGRLEAMQEETKFYTGTDDYVKSAKLETAGDWVVLAACPEADRLVGIVRNAAK